MVASLRYCLDTCWVFSSMRHGSVWHMRRISTIVLIPYWSITDVFVVVYMVSFCYNVSVIKHYVPPQADCWDVPIMFAGGWLKVFDLEWWIWHINVETESNLSFFMIFPQWYAIMHHLFVLSVISRSRVHPPWKHRECTVQNN